jgi:membrane protease YdiL (CAAX protease family)
MQSIAGVSETSNEKKSWSGFWSGFIWFIVGFVCIAASQIAAIAVLAVLEVIQFGAELSEERMEEIALDGDALAFAFLFSLPMIVAILAFVVKIRRRKPFFDYLGIRPVEKKVLAIWLLYAVGFFVAALVCDRIFSRPPIPEWMLTAYISADYPWLFFISVAVLAPLSEELLYRGYIIRVWAESISGPVVGTVLLSLMWAAIHLQYGLYDMTWIFFMGIILCVSRLRTNSIVPAFIIHAAWNTVSLVILVLYIRDGGIKL